MQITHTLVGPKLETYDINIHIYQHDHKHKNRKCQLKSWQVVNIFTAGDLEYQAPAFPVTHCYLNKTSVHTYFLHKQKGN